MTERDDGKEIVVVVAVALETWTPARSEQFPREFPTHRMIYDARTDKLRCEWQNAPYGWNPCKNPDHLPVLTSE